MKRIHLIGLPADFAFGVEELKQELGLRLSEKGTAVLVQSSPNWSGLSLTRLTDGVAITYGKKHDFFRALSYLPAFLDGGEDICETNTSSMLCYMADQSRNAVYNMPSAKQMIRCLAKMGYDSMMLYTEDTFALEGYPYFGHMRGRFSKEELKEIDDYAFGFGIEVIPCIQTLAHLKTALRWPDFNGYKDTADILMVGDDRTYRFVEAILKTCKECFRSARIDIGMDEAHELARGNYLLKNGYRKSSDVMLEHLNRVVDLCTSYGYHPMMWSDMFFRMAFNGAYRVREGEIAQEIIDRVPENLTLIYWDYYSLDRQIFGHMLDCHLKFHNPIAFAGGAWKWYGFAPHNKFSIASTKMQLDLCAERGIDQIIVTSWGDDGGDAAQFSTLVSLLYFAERAYHPSVSDEQMDSRAEACFGIGYEALLTLDAPNELPGVSVERGWPANPSRYLLFNDPLEGLMDAHLNPDEAPEAFSRNAEKLRRYASHPVYGYLYDTLAKLCDVLALKCDLSVRAREAYLAGDKSALAKVADRIPVIVARLDLFIEAYRFQWYRENKTFGFTTQELRLGGLRERLNSTYLRLRRYVAGEIDSIEELEQPVLSYNGKKPEALAEYPYISQMSWQANAAVGLL